MSSVCFICSEPYTTNGTGHALYSTKCGHLMGKSCLEEWIRRTRYLGRFNCPACRELLLNGDYHPIYDFSNEPLKSKFEDSKDKYLSEDNILKDCLSGKLKKGSTFFVETRNREIGRMFIEFFDVHNEYILIAGHLSYKGSSLQIYKGADIVYDTIYSYTNIITVALNKFCKNAVGFCVGFLNGNFLYVVLSITNSICGAPHENVLSIDCRRLNSVCFLDENKIVHSVGECNIFSVRTDKLSTKENWLGNVNVELKAVTNLTVKSESVLLGIMDGKIYIFEKNKIPYVVYFEENIKVTNYKYDPVVDMLSIVKSLEFQVSEDSYENNLSHVIRGMSKIPKYDNEGCRREIYMSYPVQDFTNITYHLPQHFKPTLISAKNYEKCFVYSFIPNEENGMLQMHFINDAFKVVGEKKIGNLNKCLGIFALKEPEMSSICFICSEPYTTNGTDHALYSTKCGHLMGKSCLEEWIRQTSNQGRFNCPTCRKLLLDGDYHPIYDFSNELLRSEFNDSKDKYLSEDEILKDCLSGRLKKESTFYIETGNREISRMFIEFFDVLNEYIWIVGHFSYKESFLQIHKGNDIVYDTSFPYSNISTVAFNKFREDAAEFCIGFQDGILQKGVLNITNGTYGVSNGDVLFNMGRKINSISFLEKKKFVYSVGECNIFSVPTDNFSTKENWLEKVNIELKAVTNLTVKSESVLLGIMDGKIYIFEKNKIPYVVYFEENIKVTNYKYDPVVDMLSIVKSLEFQVSEDIYENNLSHVICGLSKTFNYDNEGYRREVYMSYPIQHFPDITYYLPQQFKPVLISATNYEKYFIYSFIPSEENDMLQVHFVNGAFNVVGKRKIENLNKCLGILALKEPEMSSICFICSESYTTNGTDHALYSTKCGHLMGKSCLEEWIRQTSNQGRFNCPTCRKLLLDGDYHPIYDFSNEILKSEFGDSKDKYLCEDDIMKECLSGRVKKGSTFFLETGNKRISRMFIQFFDVHNEYILVAGHLSYEKTFLQVHKGNDIFYDKLFSYTNFITAAFNKFYEDAVKFCVGFPDGLIEHIVLPITNGVCSVPYESLLINENGQINSICFLEKKKVVYSVGECSIFSLRTDKVVVKENWLGNVNVKLKAVTNLTVKSDSVLLGIMDGKIYIFEKNKVPYIVYSEENIEVINYTFDPVVDMISIVNSLKYQGSGDIYDPDFDMILILNSLEFGCGEDIYEKNVSNTLRGISKIFMYDNKGCRRKDCLSGRLNIESILFMETGHTELKENMMMNFSDAHNRHVLVAGNDDYEDGEPPSFVRIYKGMDMVYYRNFGSSDITAVAINKFCEDKKINSICFLEDKKTALIQDNVGVHLN
uniref:RING-type domain-containing protein n=1 Tax=Strongyloides papillosus TaxID=174720 RepID=A0A0N5BCC0_STREA